MGLASPFQFQVAEGMCDNTSKRPLHIPSQHVVLQNTRRITDLVHQSQQKAVLHHKQYGPDQDAV